MSESSKKQVIDLNSSSLLLEGQILKDSLLFKDAPDSVLNEIAESLSCINFKVGDPVFIENEISDSIYIVKSGKLEIIQYDAKIKNGTRIKVMKTGDILSELSVLAKTNHSTSCFAMEDSELYCLKEHDFYSLIHKHPELSRSVVNTLARLTQQLNSKENYIEYFKENQIQISKEIIKIVPFSWLKKFSMIPLNLVNQTLSVALQNPFDNSFYSEFTSKYPGTTLKIYKIKDVDLEKHQKIISNYYTGYLNVEKNENDKVIHSQTTYSESSDIKTLLLQTTIIGSLPNDLIENLILYFKPLKLSSGSYLFEPNSPSDALYIILNGQIEILKPMQENPKSMTLITSLSTNDSIGEISLLTNSLNTTYAKATQDSDLLYLPKSTFEALLGNVNFCISIARALAKKIQYQNKLNRTQIFSDVSQFNETAVSILPKDFIIKHKMIPIQFDQNSILLGAVNSDDGSVHKVINYYLSKYRITLNSISMDTFQELCKKAKIPVSVTSTILQQQTGSPKVAAQDTVRYVENLIILGFKLRASDIHIEADDISYSVRFRIDGSLVTQEKGIDKAFGLQILNRIKVLCKMDISESRYPQDGQMILEKEGQKYTARVSSVPSKLGEKFVLRLIHEKTSLVPMNRLAADKNTIKFLKSIVKNKQGLFLITGPTGSGKTTTLYSLLNEINEVHTNIVSVENPVELVIPGIAQIEVNESIELGYNRILRHVLRQDPDTIMVGEIRDSESAEIVFQSAMTGHLVFSTIHTTNSVDTIPRLVELGVSLQTIGAGLLGVMAQRLIPALCNHCKYMRPVTAFERDIFKYHLPETKIPNQVADARGCQECDNRKFKGRIPVFEYWKNTSTVKNVILSGGSHNDILAAIKLQDFRSLYKFAIQMTLNGLTTLEQVERYLYGMDFDDFTGF